MNRSTMAMVLTGAVLLVPSPAGAQVPPGGPWPAPVAGGSNPLVGGTLIAGNGVIATPDARLRVWLPVGRRRRTAITRHIDGRVVLRGRLSNRITHQAIARAYVIIASELAGSPGWTAMAGAATSRRGTFRVLLPAGATRRIAALYWPHAASAAPIYSRRLLVRASPHIAFRARRASRRRVRFSGRVSGAPIPPGGLLVAIQVRNGPHWPIVRLVRTLPSGRFFARYRFKYPRRYTVRASVPKQTSWPLYGGRSPITAVRSR